MRRSPNKSNALYGWTYRLGGDAGPAPCLCIVELSIDFVMDISWGPPWPRNQRDLQLLFMFMQISYVIWYALNLDIIRIVYVFKLACTLIIH